MNELEGMINGLLSNPEEMKKLVDMAGKIINTETASSGGADNVSEEQSVPDLNSILSNLSGSSGDASKQAPDLGSILGSLGGEAGGTIQALQQLLGGGAIKKIMSMGAALGEKNDKKPLIDAIKPWLSEQRRNKLDKAMIFAKVMRVAGVAGVASVFKRGG